MDHATDNTISRNKQKNKQETEGETSGKTESENKTYQLDELLKSNGLLEQVYDIFDRKCFLQVWYMEVIKMERPVNRYKVSNFSKVDTTKYMTVDIFYTDKDVGVLINNKIKKFPGSMPNLKDYV